jgi:hypothetical protein
MSRDRDDDNNTTRLICSAWNGSRSPLFAKFRRDFRTGTDAMFLQEDDSSIWSAMDDMDQGGSKPGAERMPAPQQSGFQNAQRREKKRHAKAFSLIYRHVDDERLREMLDALPPSNRRGTAAWQLIERECANGTTDLEILDYRLDFQQCTIESDVGYSEETILKFSRVLNSLNARLPSAPVNQRYDEDQMSVKMLSNINHPESLALEAVKELRAPEGSRAFERTITVGGRAKQIRDYQAIVTHFDSVWRGLFKQGVIRPRAPGKRNDAGALLVREPDHAHLVEGYDEDAGQVDAQDAAYYSQFNRRGKGYGRWGRGGRGGRGGGRSSSFSTSSHQQPRTDGKGQATGDAGRPRLCDACWRAALNADSNQRLRLVQALLGRQSARAFLADEDDDDADVERDAQDGNDHADQVQDQVQDLVDHAQVRDEYDDDMADYVNHVSEYFDQSLTLAHVRPNAEVNALSRHNTSVHLGLAADSVACPDYDMASLPTVKPAYRQGVSIGEGLFTERDAMKGDAIVAFEDGDMMPVRHWPSYALRHNLAEDWAAIMATRCLPPPTKAVRTVMLYDKNYRDGRRPLWTYLNHSLSPNVEMRIPRTGCTITWFAITDIKSGDELCFSYGGDTSDFDRLNVPPTNETGKRPRRHATSLSNYSDDLYGPYRHASESELYISATEQEEATKSSLVSAAENGDDHSHMLWAVQESLRVAQEEKFDNLYYDEELARAMQASLEDAGVPLNDIFELPKPTKLISCRLPKKRADGTVSVVGESSSSPLSQEVIKYYFAQRLRWIADSGCSVHCVSDSSMLTTINRKGSCKPLNVADQRSVHVECTGTIDVLVNSITPDGSSAVDRVTLHRVLAVPSFSCNLFSCSAGLKKDNIRVVLFNTDGSTGYLELPSKNRVYFHPSSSFKFTLSLVKSDDALNVDVNSSADPTLMHRRLAHFGKGRLHASGVRSDHDPNDCEACAINLKRAPIPSKSRVQRNDAPRCTRFGQRINSDLLAMPVSFDGYQYIITFVDEASSEASIRFLKSKAAIGVLHALQSFVAQYAHMLEGGRVQTWHSDNGGEFDHADIDAYCNAVSTYQTRTPARTPELNGKAERLNGIILRGVRILLAESNLTELLWPFAATQVVAIHNRLVSRAHNPPISPFEFNRKRTPNLDKYKVWGCKCFVQLEKEERTKFGLLKTDPTGMTAVHLGYDHTRRGYYVYVPQIKRYTTVRTIKFHETQFVDVPELARHERTRDRDKLAPAELALIRTNIRRPVIARPATGDEPAVNAGNPVLARPVTANSPDIAHAIRMIDAPSEVYVTCGRHTSAVALKVSDQGPIDTPKSFAEAINGAHAEQWKRAMLEDLQGKRQNGPNGAWTLVDLAVAEKLGRKPLKGKWIYKIKYEPDGYTIAKFKARWVGCGFAQREHIDYNETFASTIRAITVRIVFGVAAKLDLMLGVFDVVKAFTQSEMTELLFVEQPTGFEVKGKICKLNMALEGTKQAAHLWQQNLNKFMIEFGFERSLADPCLYVKHEGEIILICAVHVDDVLVAYNDVELYEQLWSKFNSRFKATRGPVEVYLGMEVTRNRDHGSIRLTQRVYIEKLFHKYLSEGNTKLWTTPIDMSREGAAKFYAIATAESERETNEMSGKDFNGLIGSLLYASCMTRPDVTFYVAFLCQFMQAPSLGAWTAALSVASYLYSTKDMGISFNHNAQTCNVNTIDLSRDRLIVFSDASFGREVNPFAGGFIQWANGPISWMSRKAKFIPQSSCESEVFGAVMVLKEAEFAAQVIGFLTDSLEMATGALIDNKAAYDVIRCPGATKRTVHFNRWLHFARSLCLLNKVEMFLVSTEDMMGDIFTKALDKTKFIKCRDYIMSKQG